MSTGSLDQVENGTERRNHLKSIDRGIPFKKMAKLLSKRLMKVKEQEFPPGLVDQAWFHGRMTSDYAVKVLNQEGEFLVRENPSRLGDYTLSVNQNGVVKHCTIERTTKKNLKYKYKLFKSSSFESLVDLVGFLYSNKKVVTAEEEILLRAPANRDSGLLIPPELAYKNRSAPVSPSRTPPPSRRERNSSDPNLLVPERLLRCQSDVTQLSRERPGSRSSPPSLYVDNEEVKMSDNIYDTINLPSKTRKIKKTSESLIMKKKQAILSEVFQMFKKSLFPEFLKHDCLTLAKHMTRLDLEIVWGENFHENSDDVFSDPSGLELILFDDGTELRHRILERSNMITLWVSSMIISYGDVADRVDMLKVFIGIAHALYSCLGNLNGFMAVMEGLEVAQVKRLTETWRKLEEDHPKLSIIYHNNLKSLYAILNSNGSHPAPGKVKPCLPYIAHVVKCLEHGPNSVENIGNGIEELDELEVMFNHLRTARDYGNDVESYRRQAVGFVTNMMVEKELYDYFVTTINVAKSVGLGFNEDNSATKLNALLALMSEYVEPEDS